MKLEYLTIIANYIIIWPLLYGAACIIGKRGSFKRKRDEVNNNNNNIFNSI